MAMDDTLQQLALTAMADGRVASDLDLVFEHVGLGLGIVDRDLRFLHVNAQLADINGHPVERHIGRTIPDLLPELAEHLVPKLQSVLDFGDVLENLDVHGETAALPGVLRHWKASYYPKRDTDGDIVGLLFVTREVTDEVRMQGALADSESRLYMALEGTGLGVWDWSVETDEVWFSDTWQTMLGYEPGEVPQHISSWQNGVHPDDWPVINAALEPHLAGLTPQYECEHRVRCKDGSWLWILDRGKVVTRSEDGRPLRMVGTHDNINSRKKDQLYRGALLELSRDLAELDTVDRIVDRALLAVLDTLDVDFAAYTFTGEGPGYPRMARRWRDGRMGSSQGLWMGGRLFKEIGRRMVKGEAVVWKDLANEPFMEGAEVGNPADGRDIAAMIGVPIMRHDWLIGTMLAGSKSPRQWADRQLDFLSDVRDRAREAIARAEAGEANQQAQEELQRIGRLNALSALTSTLAHELNQPLAAANNYLTAAKLQARRCTPEGMAPEKTPEHIIELATQQVFRAGEIIRRMRTFTQSGEVTARLTNVTQATDKAIETTLSSMSPRPLVIRKSYADDLPDVMLDPVQFEQVISNLVRNAIEAMDDVETPELGVSIRQQGGDIMIEVTDNGPGFSPGVLETLFQPFRTEKRRGLGLGLPICRTVIEAHGGKIAGEAGEECGARFSITLPAKTQ